MSYICTFKSCEKCNPPDKKKQLSRQVDELLCCPFCGSPAELRPGELKPTLEEAMITEKSARCSAHYCPARFIACAVSEWNTRAT